jgi:hypothetical protein
MVDQDVLSSGFLNLIVTAERPLRWMIHYAGTHHVQVDVGEYGFEVIFSLFPLFLGGSIV